MSYSGRTPQAAKFPRRVENSVFKSHACMAWLTRTSCSRCSCGTTTFQENFIVSAASTSGGAVLFCWKPPATTWAQETGRSSSVPFFRHRVGTGDRNKLFCALLAPQSGHRRQEQALLYPSCTTEWARETGTSFSVPLNQGMGHYTQDLIITPRVSNKTGICAQASTPGLSCSLAWLCFRNSQFNIQIRYFVKSEWFDRIRRNAYNSSSYAGCGTKETDRDGELARGISENSMSDIYGCRSGRVASVLYSREWIL